MAVCSVDTLLANNPCYAALQPFEQEVLITQLLCNLLAKLQSGGEITCDVQTLLTQGKCFYAMPRYILKALQASLLCQISQSF